MSSGLHGSVSSQGSDGLLGATLNVVADPLGISLGIGSGLGSVGLGLLGGALGGHGGVSDRVADGLLGASHVRVGSVGESFGHIAIA